MTETPAYQVPDAVVAAFPPGGGRDDHLEHRS
ncbi:hypothetical protein ABH931_005306 [Streptacidiphilus sp. MAP12-33]